VGDLLGDFIVIAGNWLVKQRECVFSVLYGVFFFIGNVIFYENALSLTSGLAFGQN